MEHQLRRYTIKPGRMSDFVRRWTAGVVPLRESFGFQIQGAWSVEETNEFVWIISYDGPEGLEAADFAYYNSEERKSLAPNPAVYIAAGDHWSAERVV